MKTKELRQGNWVKTEHGYRKVETIEQNKIGTILKPCRMVLQHFNLDKITPITLTEEILLKLGWSKLPHFTVMNSLTLKLNSGKRTYSNRELSIGCVGTPNEMLFLKEDDDLVVLHNWDYDGALYLHKLQNICYDFGEELTLETF